jgi:hypothetical protein
MEDTPHTMNTMQIQLQLQLIKETSIIYTKQCTHISPRPSLHSTSLHLCTIHILTIFYFPTPHFTSLHFTSLHFASLITFLTLFLKLLGLHERVPKASAGSWNDAHCQDKNVKTFRSMSPSWNLLNNATCRNCGQEQEPSSYHIFCQYPGLDEHRMKNFGFALMEPIDISRALIKHVMALAWGKSFSEGPQ